MIGPPERLPIPVEDVAAQGIDVGMGQAASVDRIHLGILIGGDQIQLIMPGDSGMRLVQTTKTLLNHGNGIAGFGLAQ